VQREKGKRLGAPFSMERENQKGGPRGEKERVGEQKGTGCASISLFVSICGDRIDIREKKQGGEGGRLPAEGEEDLKIDLSGGKRKSARAEKGSSLEKGKGRLSFNTPDWKECDAKNAQLPLSRGGGGASGYGREEKGNVAGK